jgi:hypothetical protein
MSVDPHCIEHTETASEIQFEAYCHLFPRQWGCDYSLIELPFSYCGVPRAEQARHGIFNFSVDAVSCSKCGLKRCQSCLELARRNGRL